MLKIMGKTSYFLNINEYLLTDRAEIERITQYLDEVTARWKKMRVEISSMQTMLESAVQYWTQYNACMDLLQVWLTDAERMIDRPRDERGVNIV